MPDSKGKSKAAALVMILTVAAALRVWHWPARYEVRDVDETGYLSSSLCLVEGITPGYKPSPAGPQIWLGWAWAEGALVWNELHPSPEAKTSATPIRVFLAADRGLFDLYHDMSRMRQFVVAFNVAISLLAVAAGFGFGARFGGTAGAIVVGGLLAACPMLVDYADQSRPYAFGWSFAVMALFAAGIRRAGPGAPTPAASDSQPQSQTIPTSRGDRLAFWSSAILMGLAIGSRVEMLLMFPLLWWTWSQRPKPWRRRLLELPALTCGALFFAYAVAPWLLTGLPGNLRAIATIQMANPRTAQITRLSILREFGYENGLGPVFLGVLAVAGFFAWRPPGRFRSLTLAGLVILLTCTVFKSTGFGLHHSGAAVVTVIMGAGALAGLAKWRPVFVASAVAVIVLFPLGRSLLMFIPVARHPAITASADWVDAHVPAGTPVYTYMTLFKTPLPTAADGDRIWGEVTAPDAGRRKFASGAGRFNLSADKIPRIMSEENLVQERGNVRRFFILGGETDLPAPRYDLQLIEQSPVFGLKDVAASFSKTGGVVLWRESVSGPPPAGLGSPAATLHDCDGTGDVLVFCSPELRAAVNR